MLNMVNLVSDFFFFFKRSRDMSFFLILLELVKLIIKHPLLYFRKFVKLKAVKWVIRVKQTQCGIFQYSWLCVIQREHKHTLPCLHRKSLLILSQSANFHYETEIFNNSCSRHARLKKYCLFFGGGGFIQVLKHIQRGNDIICCWWVYELRPQRLNTSATHSCCVKCGINMTDW